ncbi:hypothetical protein [Cobetia crustatorum]|uniref:hypothetical protein n=1 Tax=Cobetia crustatorum TaxID=553385 RepID=UPI00068677AF|nr:hypothetical protein [Cobetia crustatorum]
MSLYGRGHYSTVATHSDRWGQFAQWAKDNGVKDLATTPNQALLERYAEHLQTQVMSGDIAVSTAQNLLSSANTTFLALRGDHRVRVSPSQYAGKRSNVRQTAPTALDTDKVTQTCRALEAAAYPARLPSCSWLPRSGFAVKKRSRRTWSDGIVRRPERAL